MNQVADLALQWGISPDYVDATGQHRQVETETLQKIIDSLSHGEGGRPPARAGRTITVRHGRPIELAAVSNGDAPARWEVTESGRPVASGGGGRLPALPVGLFGLALTSDRGVVEHRTLLVAPEHAYQSSIFTADARVWVIAVQLYAVRSRRNWGHGDFTDLAALLDLAAELGAAGVGLNPLHALFDDRPGQVSPYSPNSRLFLNHLYVDLDAVPEFPGLEAAGLADDVARLRQTSEVDYAAVGAAKRAALTLSYRAFRTGAIAERLADFEAFRREAGMELQRYAAYETLRRRFGGGWQDWPAEWREPTPEALARLRKSAAEEVEYHEYVQWNADRQLAACRARARRRWLSVGLYLDVAVGVDPSGADAWGDQRAILPGLTVGAPPDAYNPAGQDWSLAALNPHALEEDAGSSFRRTLAAVMRHAGAIRIDHILGLYRLYLIPRGMGPRHGTYVRFPLDLLLAVVAQESERHRCVVIGEDLGTVPGDLRGILADWGIWSYKVMLFERLADGSFRAPDEYAANALITFSTHDLPTFSGWSSGYDLDLKHRLGVDPGESEAERARAHAALREALVGRGLAPARGFAAVAAYLAAAPSRILAISLEDALGVMDQPNMPGTVDEHPNWRRRLPDALESLFGDQRLRELATVLDAAGRRDPGLVLSVRSKS